MENYSNLIKLILFLPIMVCLSIVLYPILACKSRLNKNKTQMLVGLVGICFLVVCFVSFVLPEILIKEYGLNFEKFGVYGDMFGCFNALMSALAFGGLIYTIILQRHDLAMQREELKLTRIDLERQAEAQEAQARLLREQIEKDIRPYINAYLDFDPNKDALHRLILKNVGKTACRNFSMKANFLNVKDDGDEKRYLGLLKSEIESFQLDVFPAGIRLGKSFSVNSCTKSGFFHLLLG